MSTSNQERGRRMAQDLGDTLAEAESMLKHAATETGERADDLRLQVDVKLRAAMSKLQDFQDEAIDRAKAAAQVTDAYVRDKPWQAVGLTAAVFFLAGILVGRR